VPVYWYRSCSVCGNVRVIWAIPHGDSNYMESDDCRCWNSHLITHHVDIEKGVVMIWNEDLEEVGR